MKLVVNPGGKVQAVDADAPIPVGFRPATTEEAAQWGAVHMPKKQDENKDTLGITDGVDADLNRKEQKTTPDGPTNPDRVNAVGSVPNNIVNNSQTSAAISSVAPSQTETVQTAPAGTTPKK